MKTKLFFSLFFAAVMICSCKKEKNQPNNGNGSTTTPPPVTTGSLYFKNIQTDPYAILLDGSGIGTLMAGSTSSAYTISSGISHTCKATQSSGYILYPTVFTGTATVNPGGTITWSF